MIFVRISKEKLQFTGIIADAELYQQCVNDPVSVIRQLLLYSYFYPFNQINVTALAVKVKNYYLGETMPTDMGTVSIIINLICMTNIMLQFSKNKLHRNIEELFTNHIQ